MSYPLRYFALVSEKLQLKTTLETSGEDARALTILMESFQEKRAVLDSKISNLLTKIEQRKSGKVHSKRVEKM